MIEESNPGWCGEDGIPGPCSSYGDRSGNVDINHDNMGDGAVLESTTNPNALAANSTTLFNETTAQAGHLAYLLQGQDGCWTKNDSDGYYVAVGACQ